MLINDAYSLSIRVQTTVNHISIFTFLCFIRRCQRQRKCFLSECELKKALRDRDTLTRAAWFGFDWFVLSMRMQVILDSSFARPGSAPIWGGKKGEFRDWTKSNHEVRMSTARVHGNTSFSSPEAALLLVSTKNRDSWCWPKGARPLGTRMGNTCAQHSKTKMADGGKRSSRTEGFHMFRVWDPKTWLGNTKITEAFVYQLCCGYRTVKSRRQPVKISTNFVFLPGYSSSALRYSSDYSAWLRIATYFLMNGGLTLLEMNDCACSLRGRLLGLFWRIRELEWIANWLW